MGFAVIAQAGAEPQHGTREERAEYAARGADQRDIAGPPVADLVAAVLKRGNGAAFQRSAYLRSGRLLEVVSSAAAATAR